MENVPKESETIAVKRSERISQKIARAGRLGTKAVWWNGHTIELASLGLILAINLWTVLPFFGHQLPDVPFSGPVVPAIVKFFELLSFTHNEASLSVLLIFYLFLPLTFYLYVRWVTHRKLAGFFAAIFVSLPISPFARARIDAGFFGNDAPHIEGVTLVPLALFGILMFLRHGDARNLIIASVSSALVALTSPFTFFAFAFSTIVCTFSEMLLGKGRLKFMRFLTVIMFSATLIAFWFHPSFIFWMISGPMGNDVRFVIGKLIPISLFVIPTLAVFGFLLFDRKEGLQPLFLSSFSTLVFGLITVAGGGLMPSHPARYLPEFGQALALFLGLIMVSFADALRFGKLPKLPPSPLIANICVGVIIFVSLVGTLFTGRTIASEQSKVLGIWTDVNKGQIWQARDSFGGISPVIGTAVSVLSVAGLVYIYKSSKSKPGVLS